jgi:maltose O-acetyltransferase
MFAKIKSKIKSRLIQMILSSAEASGGEFYRNLQDRAREDRYNHFRKRFSIDPGFRFNGEMILLYGEGEIHCGKNSYISDYSMLQSYGGCRIEIGEGCSISSNVRVFTQTNNADEDFSVPGRSIKTGNVIIKDYVWIGANVIINPGITIGRNAVIGANSVVTKDIPENAIYGGVPAVLIRYKKGIKT